MEKSGGLTPANPTQNQWPHAPVRPKSTPDFDSLSRCAACYNPKMNSMSWQEDDESSSSDEDSGPEMDSESESGSSSSSSSWSAVEETPAEPEMETHSPTCGNNAEPDAAGGDADGWEVTGEMLDRQRGERGTKGRIQRAPLVKSLSLPPSFTSHLSPVSLLPRPRRIVSTLHLQVLPKVHKDDTVVNICQQLSARHDRKTEERCRRGEEGEGRGRGGEGGGGGGLQPGSNNHKPPPQPFWVERMRFPWQQTPQPTLQQLQQMSYQYHQHFRSGSAQGKRSSPA